MYQLDLTHQLKLWISLGIIIFPLSAAIFSVVLKYVVKSYLKIFLSFGKAFYVQLAASFFCWGFLIIPIFGSQFLRNNTIWQTLTGVASILISAGCYSKMIKQKEGLVLGIHKGLKLSAIMTALAILILIPINMIRA